MAITVEEQPPLFHPLYHPVIWLLDSTLKSQDQFRYVIEIVPEAPGIARKIDISPRPGDGFGRQDLSQHLRDYVNQDILDIKQTGATLSQKASRAFYSIKLFEKFKDGSGNEQIIAGATFLLQTGLNTIFNRNDWVVYDQDKWRLTDSNSNLLWNIEDNVEVFKDDIFFIHVAALTGVYDYVIEEHFANGTSLITTASITFNVFTHWFRMDLSVFLTDPDNAIKFCIKFQQAAVDFSREYCVTLIDGCSRFTNLKFVYLDYLGSYNSINFDHISRKTDTSNPKTFKKFTDALVKEDVSRPLTRYFDDPTEVHTANTDYLTDEHNIMVSDLILSQRVYLDVRNNPDYPDMEFMPVEILTRTIQEAESENMDLAQFTINWRFSFDKIGR